MEDRKGGFPHSEIAGSKGASASPALIAACHVLHRLSTPRHPSEALQRLIVSQQNSCVDDSRDWKDAAGSTPDFCQTMSSLEPDLEAQGGRSRSSFTMSIAAGPETRTKPACDASWWSQTGSNRRPHACKARALPAELWPRNQKTNARSIKVVGLGRLELPTSRLSSARSNQLSYKPLHEEPCAARDRLAADACTAQPLARVRPRRKRNEDGEIPPMELNSPETDGP